MLVLAVQTGLRISELIGLSHGDVVLDAGAHVRCMGKGRKERATPLTGLTVAVLRAWLTENPGQAHDPLFPTRTGTRLSHDAIEHRLAVHLATARASCPSLRPSTSTLHTLRHTCAMTLLRTPESTSPSSHSGSAAPRGAVLVSPAQRAEMRGVISGSDG